MLTNMDDLDASEIRMKWSHKLISIINIFEINSRQYLKGNTNTVLDLNIYL